MFNFGLIYNVIFILQLYFVCAEISDKRACADKDCTVPISNGVTLLGYGSNDQKILSFKQGADVTIYSKSAGKRLGLWGAEINGRRGYIPMSHIREHKILTSKLPFVVDTEVVESNSPSHESTINQEKVSPHPVKAPYDIIEGTTVYIANDAATNENTIVSDDSNHNKKTEHLSPEDLMASKDSGSQTQNEKKPEGSLVGNKFSSFENEAQENLSTLKENESRIDNLEEIEVETEIDDASAVIEVGDIEKIPISGSSDSVKLESGVSPIIDHENTSEEFKPTETFPDPHNTQDNIPTVKNYDHILDTNTESLELPGSDEAGASNSPEILEHKLDREVLKSSLNAEPPHNENVQAPETSKFLVTETVLPLKELSIDIKPVSPDPNTINKNEEVEHKSNVNEPKEAIDRQSDQVQEQQTYSAPNLEKDNTAKDKIVHSFQNLNVPEQSIKQKQQFQTIDVAESIQQNIAYDISHDHNDDLSSKTLNYGFIESSSNQEILEENTSDNHEQPETFIKVDDAESPTQKPTEVTTLDVTDVNQTASHRDELSDLKTKDNLAAADTEIPFHHHDSPKTENPILPQPGLFSNMFTSSAESADLHSINSDFINKNEKSETLNPTTADTEQHSELPDGNHHTLFPEDVDFGTERDNVIEETNSSEINEISSFTPEDVINIGDRKPNELIMENIPEHSLIGTEVENANDEHLHDFDSLLSKPHTSDHGSCSTGFRESDCPTDDSFHHLPIETPNENIIDFNYFKLPVFTYEVFLVLIVSAVTVVVFLWGYFYIDRSKKEGPLVAKINDLQKQFLILKKENELLTEKVSEVENENMNKVEAASNEIIEDLNLQLSEAKDVQLSLEQQIQTLEKDLENSTEVGLELNRILSEFLNSDNGSGTLIANIDQLQRQLVEQQGTINSYNETLSVKETELHELRLEFEISNSRVNELQSELNKMALNLLKLEEDKEQLQNNYETDLTSLKNQLEESATKFKSQLAKISKELGLLQQKYDVSQRSLELKTNEYKLLKENINHINSDNNNSDILKSMFDTTSIKAELLQLRNENQLVNERLQQESNRTSAFEKQAYLAMEDALQLKTKYDTADQERMEAQTKLEILSNYFKERESQLQKELSKQESMWIEKQGEATSTVERIKYMQEELQNYKAQYESLKQEILAQEVDMKSQISVLEKKAHENWVAARQAERKLEDAKQEAAQLRNRLTLRERNLNDDKVQNRMVSPLEQNGDISLNDTGTSLPLMFGTREHLTTSPPLPSLPHFLPPPPGVPFMPPPLGSVHLPPPAFLPPPSMIPGDHRPPPLGRISSPPLNSRYSPDSMGYSHYNRNSPSPTSDDEYDRPMYRSYSPYNRDDRRDFNRPPPPPPPVNRNAVRNHRGTHSSGSAHSNESLEKINRHNSKV